MAIFEHISFHFEFFIRQIQPIKFSSDPNNAFLKVSNLFLRNISYTNIFFEI